MATLFDRFRNVFTRARVAKFDANSLAQELGVYGWTHAGSNVTEANALQLAAVYACVQRISSSIAGLGLELYERNGRNIEIANAHSAYDLTRRAPNPHQTAFEFWETIFSLALVNGVGRAVIVRNTRGEAQEMYIVGRDDVDEREVKGKRVFVVKNYGTVFPEDMLEICNLQRKSPISLHRENLGLASASLEFGSKYFGNGGQMTGVMSSDMQLRKEQMKDVIDTWRTQGEAGTKMLSHGFKYQRISINPDEAQFIETRKFQNEEICRIFGVPPNLIFLDTQTTYNNTEQQAIQFARHTLTPWAVRAEQELDKKLLTARQREVLGFKYRLSDLWRGDMEARSKFYREMFHIGAMSTNEIREQENLNPIAGGDAHLVALNLIDMEHHNAYSSKLANSNTVNSQEQNN